MHLRVTVISARLMGEAKAVQAMGLYGFAKEGHCLFGAALAPKETATMRMTLKEGEDYLWFGAGDDVAELRAAQRRSPRLRPALAGLAVQQRGTVPGASRPRNGYPPLARIPAVRPRQRVGPAGFLTRWSSRFSVLLEFTR